jgi:TRAP-type C4-dicarboxylate transport system permease small subunit
MTTIRILKTFDKIILTFIKTVTLVSFALLTLIMTANVIIRKFPVFSMHGFDEIIEMLFALMIFFGAAALWINRDYFSVGSWIHKMTDNKRIQFAYRLFIELLILLFVLVFLTFSVQIVQNASAVSNVYQIPQKYFYMCMPISACIMLIYTIRNLICEAVCIFKPDMSERLFSKFKR